jgi:sec-independent protein translocase protein TatA
MIAMFAMNGPWEWIIILVVVLIFFGAGKLPNVLGQMGKGVKAFKNGMKDGEEEDEPKSIDTTAQTEQQDTTESYVEAEEVHR